MTDRILMLAPVADSTGNSIYLKISEGTFPVGAHAVGWFESQVRDWLENPATT